MSVSLSAPTQDFMGLAILKRLPSPDTLVEATTLKRELRKYIGWESLSDARFSYRMRALVERQLIVREKTGPRTVGYRITKAGMRECEVAAEFCRTLDTLN